MSTQIMTVAVRVTINGDGVQQSTKILEWRLKTVAEDRNKLNQMLDNTKRAFTHTSKFFSKLGGVTHKMIKLLSNKVKPELRASIVIMLSYIVNNTLGKMKILPLNWKI